MASSRGILGVGAGSSPVFINVDKYWKGGCKEDGARLFSVTGQDKTISVHLNSDHTYQTGLCKVSSCGGCLALHIRFRKNIEMAEAR